MADNVQAGVGNPTIATDDIGGVHYTKVKLILGAENAADGPVDQGQQTMAASVPVAIASNQSAVPISAAAVSTLHRVAAGSGDAASVKASAGALRSVHALNVLDVPIYVKFHNTAGTPTPGSGVVFTVGVQAGLERDLVLPGGGRAFATGIGMTIVTGIADNDSTGVTASGAIVEVTYE